MVYSLLILQRKIMPTIHVKMFDGRSDEKKREYAIALTDATVKVLGCEPGSVDILFEDVKKSDWATGGVLWSDRK
jgi:4-oxalocrotonate tautomerase